MAAVCQPRATLFQCMFSFTLHYILLPHFKDRGKPYSKSHSYGWVQNREDTYLTSDLGSCHKERIQQATGYPEECVSALLFLKKKKKPSFWYLCQKICSSASDFQMTKISGSNQNCLLLVLWKQIRTCSCPKFRKSFHDSVLSVCH